MPYSDDIQFTLLQGSLLATICHTECRARRLATLYFATEIELNRHPRPSVPFVDLERY
jgi:hypothetical protein